MPTPTQPDHNPFALNGMRRGNVAPSRTGSDAAEASERELRFTVSLQRVRLDAKQHVVSVGCTLLRRVR